MRRKVHAFSSGLDAERAVVFETFVFEPAGWELATSDAGSPPMQSG